MAGSRAFSVAATLLLATAASAGPQPSEALRGTFVGWSDVDATGRVVNFAPDGHAVASVTQALREELAKQVFTPARDSNGAASPVRTYLSGRYVLEPDSEGWVLRIDEVRAGPKPIDLPMPRAHYRTHTMGESVWMRVAMTVQPDGRPTDIQVEEFQGPQGFRREALYALRKWRFEPEMIAGRHIATRVRQDYVMRLEEKDAPPGKPCPDDTSGRVLAAGQNSCLAARETVLRNIRTETTVHNLP